MVNVNKKSYSNITVQEIIDRADIGRSTFYSHFETKDELLKALCTEIFDHVFSEDLTQERTHDFSTAERSIEGETTHILYHLQDSRAYIKSILKSESGEIFMRYFKEYLKQIFKGELEQSSSDIPKEYILDHMVWDFAETVRWWMHHENYSPEDINRFFWYHN